MNKIKTLLWGSFSIFCFSACSNDIESNISDEEVKIASIEVQDRAVEATPSNPLDGTYTLYYRKTDNISDTKDHIETKISEGTIQNLGKTGIKWNELQDKHFVLSNTADITGTVSTPQDKDILWGELNATSSDLKFILTHRMAKVQVNLTIPDGWTIQTVLLTKIEDYYTFKNYGKDTDKGLVIPTGENNADLSLISEEEYAKLLPPQERNATSMLVVTVLDQDKTAKKYQSLLPYTMREEISEGQWQDTPLKFKASHLLKLNADIEENTSFDIHFTYATITDWDNKGTGHIASRPSGLYSVNDIKGWIDAWNKNDESRLKKYGKKEDDGKWTFTLRHSINITPGELDGKTLSNTINLTLKVADNHSYQIIGINPSTINLNDETYKDIIVEKLTN